MASAYPGGLDTFATNKADATVTATDHPGHHNDLADAVNKIEAELGINPSGASATVLARLAVLAAAIPTTPQIARVETTETTTSATFTALTTAGPAVTVTVGMSGILVVNIGSFISSDSTGISGGAAGFALSGATTLASADGWAITMRGDFDTGNNLFRYGSTFVFTGLAAGATTATMEYKREGAVGNAAFAYREISGWSLGI